MLDTPGGGVTPLKKESGPAGHDRRPWPPPRALPFPAVFGFAPTALEAIAPTYIGPAAIKSSFDEYRARSGR